MMHEPTLAHQIAALAGWLAEHSTKKNTSTAMVEQLQAMAILCGRCRCAACLSCLVAGREQNAWIYTRRAKAFERFLDREAAESPNDPAVAFLRAGWQVLRAVDDMPKVARGSGFHQRMRDTWAWCRSAHLDRTP
jgi:hypothetical protein